MEVSSEKSGEDVAPEMLQSSPKKNVPEASRKVMNIQFFFFFLDSASQFKKIKKLLQWIKK